MKYQGLFSLKIKKRYFKMSSAAVVIGTLRLKKEVDAAAYPVCVEVLDHISVMDL